MAGESPLSASALRLRFLAVRQATAHLVEPLSPEDCQIQSMEEASPAKWHLAHTTWFLEALVLAEFEPGFRAFDPSFTFLFNSYYESFGPRHERPKRGLLSRPSLAQVLAYRRTVDDRVIRLLDSGNASADALARVRLALEHEQQHQELLLTDIKHALFQNSTRPAYRAVPLEATPPGSSHFERFEERVARIGSLATATDFSFDNEGPTHRVLVQPFELSTAPVTNGQYLEFIRAGGYHDARLWLSDGWAHVQSDQWAHPLYWLPVEPGKGGQTHEDACFDEYTLAGVSSLDLAAPVCHLSYFEADAYATWAGARLPTEFEWEVAARSDLDRASGGAVECGPFLDTGRLHPGGPPGAGRRGSWLGGVWEWTASAYAAYPGYSAPAGPLGEYNGKFMCGQLVLRGGSCATPRQHARVSYRNFFPPQARWQFSGLRVAR